MRGIADRFATRLLALFLLACVVLPGPFRPVAPPVEAAAAMMPSTPACPGPARAYPAPAGPPSPPSPPHLALAVRASPTEVAVAGVVTFTVRLAHLGGAALEDAILSGTLPLGLDCAGCERFYDPSSRRLQWALPPLAAGQVLTYTLAAAVGAEAGWEGGVALALEVAAPGLARAVRASAVVAVPSPAADGPTQGALPAGQAGQLVSADGWLTVTLPAEAVGPGLTVAYSPTLLPGGERPRPLRRFSLDAFNLSGQAVHTFTAPIEIAYRYTWMEGLGVNPEDLYLARWDEERGAWVHLPAEVDPERRLLVAHTTHFSDFQANYFDLPSDDYLPAVQSFQEIDLYSGAATYAYPLQVPPGRGGFTPRLALSYSSGGVDWPGQPWDPDLQAGWVGYGWGLDVGSVGRQNVAGWRWHENQEAEPETCEPWYEYHAADEYSLSLDGAGHDLVAGTDGSYHTAEETYWQVWNDEEKPYPLGWYVRTRDGSVYSFTQSLWQTICWGEKCAPEDGEYQPYRWLLTGAEDPHGNTTAYSYTTQVVDCPFKGDEVPAEEAAYLSEIRYNFLDGSPRARIQFALGPREDDSYAAVNAQRCPSQLKELYKLDRITMSVYLDGDWATVRTYTLTYSYDTYDDEGSDGVEQGKLTLAGVIQCGYGGGGRACLPETSFTYYPMGEVQEQVGRNRLWTVENGYGGVVTYTYEVASEINAWRNRVETREVADGLGNTATWTYDYAPAERNRPWISGTICDGVSEDAGTEWPRTRPMGEFRGHDAVTVTDPLGGEQVHSYALDDTYRGRELVVSFRDSQGQELRRTGQDYAYFAGDTERESGHYTYAEPEIAFVYVQTATVVEAGIGGPLTRTTAYSYSAALQGGAQHGNVTHVWEYDEEGALYRTTLRGYYSNSAAWIVDRMQFENVYSETAPLTILNDPYAHWRSSSYYGYDGEDPLEEGSAPEVGDLTRVMRVLTFTADVVTETDYLATTVDTGYGYDPHGNRVTETVYGSCGYCALRDPNTSQEHWECAPAAEDPRTVTITYDAALHLYPVEVEYGNGRSETAAYDYALGLVTSTTDVNGDTTAYLLDALGRVSKVIRPGDTNGRPTVHVKYEGWGTVGEQRVEIKRLTWTKTGQPLVQDGEVVEEERYFDGLGRLIQVHQEDQDAGDWEVVQTTFYDPLGRVQAEVVPYTITAQLHYVTPSTSLARTRHAYDALGREVVVTNTDGTTITTYYDGRRVAVVDELGHMVLHESDAFGRLVEVREYTGTYDFADNPAWEEAPYAVTVYGFDVLDRLVAVTDTAENVTRIVYDRLGRKVAMDDPDMGDWRYGYSSLGELITQTDALEQVITFTYDVLSRLTRKSLPGAPDVHFCYDDCLGDAGEANSWGRVRRAWVGEAFTENGHAYRYDARGRTIAETLWVGGEGYTTTSTFDSMDRLSTTVYPDGEVIAQGYDDEGSGRLVEVVGDDVYVSGVAYTATGAVELLELGSGPVLRVDYGYYGWSVAGGRGRLAGITAGVLNDTGSLQELEYAYDLAGNVLTIADYHAGSPQTQAFGYDALNRLITATASGAVGEGGYGPEGYHYSAIGNITVKGDLAYGYEDAAHAHAVTHLTYLRQQGNQHYWYDANGNQVKRIVGGETYTLTYDAENHLTEVMTAGGTLAAFGYGPGGERITGTVGATTTVYVGAHYEVQGVGQAEVVRKYYYAGARRVAMREGETLYWLLSDHLGSQAVTAHGTTGAKVDEVRYTAWGEDRYITGTTPTSFRFTGQRSEAGIGLYYYGARWYDQSLGRFIQPDSIIPQQADPQQLNRYSGRAPFV